MSLVPVLRRRTIDVELVFVGALVAAVLVTAPAPLAVRLPFGLAAAVFYPGYSLAAALFPRPDEFAALEWIGLALGLSLAIIPIFALGLNYSPWGVREAPIVYGLTAWTSAVTIVAWWRRRATASPAFAIAFPRAGSRQPRPRSRLPLLVALAGLVLAGVVLAVALDSKPSTAFYALGSDGQAEAYPLQATAGQQLDIQLGMVSHDQPASYSVQATMGGQPVGDLAPFRLNPGATWQSRLTVQPDRSGDKQPLDISLLRDGKPYRQLRLWLDVTSS